MGLYVFTRRHRWTVTQRTSHIWKDTRREIGRQVILSTLVVSIRFIPLFLFFSLDSLQVGTICVYWGRVMVDLVFFFTFLLNLCTLTCGSRWVCLLRYTGMEKVNVW